MKHNKPSNRFCAVVHGTVGHILRAGPWEYMIRETFITISDLALGIFSYAEIRAIFVVKLTL
jgi:hypothetical protein